MNSKRGEVTFEAGGEAYSLRLTTNAMVRYEDVSGQSVIEAFNQLQGEAIRITALRGLFWAMLVGDFSEEQAGDLMDELGLQDAADKVSQTVTLAFPQAEAGNSGNGAGSSKRKI